MKVDLERVALVVHSDDNVAVAKTQIAAGTIVVWRGREIEVREDVSPGHRFALVDLPPQTPIKQYGQPFATSLGIRLGELIKRERISNELPQRAVTPASKTHHQNTSQTNKFRLGKVTGATTGSLELATTSSSHRQACALQRKRCKLP